MHAVVLAKAAGAGAGAACFDDMATTVPIWFVSLAGIGALYVSAVCLRLLAYLGLCLICLRRPKDLRRRYGSWAVVTGPTRGLGRSMAMELARRGLNLVLVDLDAANLKETSEALRRTHPAVQTRTVVFDLSLVGTAPGDEAMRRLREAVEGLDVGVLVNNAAVARPGALYVHEADVEALAAMVRVNVMALTEVTAAVLPGMLERGRGAIFNVGSGSTVAVPSFPLYTVYSSTKRLPSPPPSDEDKHTSPHRGSARCLNYRPQHQPSRTVATPPRRCLTSPTATLRRSAPSLHRRHADCSTASPQPQRCAAPASARVHGLRQELASPSTTETKRSSPSGGAAPAPRQ